MAKDLLNKVRSLVEADGYEMGNVEIVLIRTTGSHYVAGNVVLDGKTYIVSGLIRDGKVAYLRYEDPEEVDPFRGLS